MRAAVLLLSAFLAAGDPAAPASPAPAATPAPPAPASSTLVVEVEGLKDDQGRLHASLYASEEGFPTKPEKALRHLDVPIVAGKARVVFEGLTPGGYAVAA